MLWVITSTAPADMLELTRVVGAPLFQVKLTTDWCRPSLLVASPFGSVSSGFVILVCCAFSIEVAVGNINKFMGVSKGEVAMLEDVLLGGSIVLGDSAVVNTGRKLC